MKKYIYPLFSLVLLVFLIGCSKDDDSRKSVDQSVVGEWHQTRWNDQAQADFDVYIEFLTDGQFNIYQKVETSTYQRYSGDFSTNGSLISGRYSNGEPWGAGYNFEVSSDGKTLTLTSRTDTAVVSVYAKTTIPETVRKAPEVRSALSDGFRPIL